VEERGIDEGRREHERKGRRRGEMSREGGRKGGDEVRGERWKKGVEKADDVTGQREKGKGMR
jgi:hypothetical protein